VQERSLSLPEKSAEVLGNFVSEQNIAHYRKCLTETADERRRQILLKLLADELTRK
jgi:hypothetical protein